jgi:competence protein ComEA
MSAPTPTPAATPPATTSHGAQVALCVFLVVLVGLLAFRGYGNRLGARPTELVAAADLTDLNSADQKEIAQVPGVGPKLAEAIIDHRRLHGKFKSVDELKNVRGVGPVTFEKIRSQFRVGSLPQTPAAETPPSPNPQPPVAAPAPTPRPTSGSKKIQPGEPPINVNTATADELTRLPGIGPVTAQAIVASRGVAPFQNLNDLDKVKGIGPKTLEKLRPFVVVK